MGIFFATMNRKDKKTKTFYCQVERLKWAEKTEKRQKHAKHVILGTKSQYFTFFRHNFQKCCLH